MSKVRKRDKIKAKLKALTEKDMLGAMKDTLKKGFDLFKGKLGDYGTENFKEVGAIGIYLRVCEKFKRLDNLLRGEGEPNYESILDNITDVMVLSATMLAMFEKELADIKTMQKQYRSIVGEDDEP